MRVIEFDEYLREQANQIPQAMMRMLGLPQKPAPVNTNFQPLLTNGYMYWNKRLKNWEIVVSTPGIRKKSEICSLSDMELADLKNTIYHECGHIIHWLYNPALITRQIALSETGARARVYSDLEGEKDKESQGDFLRNRDHDRLITIAETVAEYLGLYCRDRRPEREQLIIQFRPLNRAPSIYDLVNELYQEHKSQGRDTDFIRRLVLSPLEKAESMLPRSILKN